MSKIVFKKQSTYGNIWEGRKNGVVVFTIVRTSSRSKFGGYDYSLYAVGQTATLMVSPFLADVVRCGKTVDM